MDYAVPGHLIEHVPDVIGWLLDLRGAQEGRTAFNGHPRSAVHFRPVSIGKPGRGK